MRAALAWMAALVALAPATAEAATCAQSPELCGLAVASVIEQPDLERAIDVVLVGDGFSDMADWHAVADDMIAALHHDLATGVYGTVDAVWNVHVVDVVSLPGGDVTDGDKADTPLGMISVGSNIITASSDRAALAAANAPDVDVTVAIANSESGRANANFPAQLASGGSIRLSRRTKPLTHELGHAAFWLADEYSETSACSQKSDAQLARQRNTTADPNCLKFESVPGAGCVEGSSYCSEGHFRSAQHCFMRFSGNLPACPVCWQTIRDTLLEVRSGADVAAPWAAILTPAAGSAAGGWIDLLASFNDDFFTPVQLAFEVDGALAGVVEATNSPAGMGLDTRALADGQHALVVHVSDTVGRSRTSPVTLFHTANGASGGSAALSWVSPKAGMLLGGPTTVVALVDSMTDDFGPVEYGVLLVDGVPHLAALPLSALSFHLDPTTLPPGPTTLQVVAVDASGQTAGSSLREVKLLGGPAGGDTTDDPDEPDLPLAITTPAPWSPVGERLALVWSGGGGAACTVSVDGAPADLEAAAVSGAGVELVVVDATLWPLGPHQLTVLCGAESTWVPVVRTDGAELAPGLVLGAPATPVSGVIDLLVAVTDADDMVTELGLTVDGVMIATGPAPHAVLSWDTGLVADGCHAVAVVSLAGDDAPATSSGAVPICVDNTPPKADLIAPLDGAAVPPWAIVALVDAWDPGGVDRIELVVDDAVEEVLEPANKAWIAKGGALVTAAAPGEHTLEARVFDLAGNSTIAGPVTVTAAGCEPDDDCDDGDPCTEGTCTMVGACAQKLLPACCTEHGDCVDADPCTLDACTAAGCKHAHLAGCCAHDAHCDDADPCTSDLCPTPGGDCEHAPLGCCATASDCDDGDDCTLDECLLAAGAPGVCAHSVPVPCCASDVDCDDGDPCTTSACEGGVCGPALAVPWACCTSCSGHGLCCRSKIPGKQILNTIC